jgi:TniQ
LKKPYPDRLPLSFRPYPGEALSSWISRAASVYGLSVAELLDECCGWNSSICALIDVQIDAIAIFALKYLLGCRAEEVLACTISGTSPDLLPFWISRVEPGWNISDHRTVLRSGYSPAVCVYCLIVSFRQGSVGGADG